MAGAQPLEIQRVQASWLRQWQKYMINTYAFECVESLEVGCGSGLVMKNIEDLVKVKGIDLDSEQVCRARELGLSVEEGDGGNIDLDDSSMDLVYSSFLLMWVKDPMRVIDEMIRVARRRVIFLSEPVWSRTIFSPPGLEILIQKEMEVIEEQGGEPDSGLDLVKILQQKDLRYRFGSVPMDTSIEETRRWLSVERNYLLKMGKEVSQIDPELFHVPFIWAVVDLSG